MLEFDWVVVVIFLLMRVLVLEVIIVENVSLVLPSLSAESDALRYFESTGSPRNSRSCTPNFLCGFCLGASDGTGYMLS